MILLMKKCTNILMDYGLQTLSSSIGQNLIWSCRPLFSRLHLHPNDSCAQGCARCNDFVAWYTNNFSVEKLTFSCLDIQFASN